MASRSTVLIAKDISKSYGDRIIIDHLSLTVHEGEAVALTGRNGAGKSTVLRMLVGADRPSSGTIEVLGKKVSETNPEFRRNVATVIDDLDFFPDLSVVEHLDLLARAHGLVDADALVDEVLEEVQLVPQSGQLPGTLSSGQRRRLGLATALVRPRKLLVLDEPEARLDVEGVAWLGKRLRRDESRPGNRDGQPRASPCRDPGSPNCRIGRPARMSRRNSKHSKPRPKASPSEPQNARAEAAVVPDPELVIAHRPDEFFGGQADERQLSLLMGDWRKGRTTRNIWQAIGDAYVLVFSLVVVLAMVISLIVQAQGQASGCTSTGCQTARGLLPWAALSGVLAFALAAARVFGPVLASAAE